MRKLSRGVGVYPIMLCACVHDQVTGNSRCGVWVMASLRALGLNRLYEPKPRFAHCAGAVGGEVCVFAGSTVDYDKTKEEL